jgi:hypothetical protein
MKEKPYSTNGGQICLIKVDDATNKNAAKAVTLHGYKKYKHHIHVQIGEFLSGFICCKFSPLKLKFGDIIIDARPPSCQPKYMIDKETQT